MDKINRVAKHQLTSQLEPDCISDGVKSCNNKATKNIETPIALVEFLIGGPYEKHGKLHPYGHVALHVKTSSHDLTYDYGRYGKVWGLGGSEGDGMLRVWSQFKRYIRSENATNRTTIGYVFQISEHKANKIIAHYKNKINSQKPNQDRGFMKQYKINNYHALTSNCTTISIDGTEAALPDIMLGSKAFNVGGGLDFTDKIVAKYEGWPEHLFMPSDLDHFLSSLTKDKAPIKTNTYKK